jgi:hypothetical protein
MRALRQLLLCTFNFMSGLYQLGVTVVHCSAASSSQSSAETFRLSMFFSKVAYTEFLDSSLHQLADPCG